MNGLDIIIVLLLLGGAIYGYRQGMVRQLVGVSAWIVGVWCALNWGALAGERLERSDLVPSEWSALVGFFLVSFAGALAMKAIGVFLHWFISRLPILRVANSFLGAPIGVIAIATLIAVVIIVLEWNPGESWAQDSLHRSVLATRLSRMMESFVETAQSPGD